MIIQVRKEVLRVLSDLLTILIAPWPPNKSTAEALVNQLLLESNYDPSTLEGKTVREILKRIPDFQPIPIIYRSGKPRNIDTTKSWTPLALFLLFWTPNLLKLVCKETNFYGFRESTVKASQKSLTALEFLYFIDTYILSGLWKNPLSKYAYSTRGGYLSGVPIGKSRRELIL